MEELKRDTQFLKQQVELKDIEDTQQKTLEQEVKELKAQKTTLETEAEELKTRGTALETEVETKQT